MIVGVTCGGRVNVPVTVTVLVIPGLGVAVIVMTLGVGTGTAAAKEAPSRRVVNVVRWRRIVDCLYEASLGVSYTVSKSLELRLEKIHQ